LLDTHRKEGESVKAAMLLDELLADAREQLRRIELCTATDKPDDLTKWQAERAKYTESRAEEQR